MINHEEHVVPKPCSAGAFHRGMASKISRAALGELMEMAEPRLVASSWGVMVDGECMVNNPYRVVPTTRVTPTE